MSKGWRKKEGFTILELAIVIFIVGILSAIGVTSFLQTIEKSRTAEAKKVLGEIRVAERAYHLTRLVYTTSLDAIGHDAPAACDTEHYFIYAVTAANDTDFTAIATRCTSGGKNPDAGSVYNVSVNAEGFWSGTLGYY